MSSPALHFENFENPQPERCLLSEKPRLTLQQAFTVMAQTIPPQGAITFARNDEGIAARIHPFAGHYEPLLSFQFHAAHSSVIIRRIHAGEQKHIGLGSALIASQLPFWQQMGVQEIGLLAHGMSEGFYKKLGFARVHRLPEYSWPRQSVALPMRLDLRHTTQRKMFENALAKAPPLSGFPSPL